MRLTDSVLLPGLPPPGRALPDDLPPFHPLRLHQVSQGRRFSSSPPVLAWTGSPSLPSPRPLRLRSSLLALWPPNGLPPRPLHLRQSFAWSRGIWRTEFDLQALGHKKDCRIYKEWTGLKAQKSRREEVWWREGDSWQYHSSPTGYTVPSWGLCWNGKGPYVICAKRRSRSV